MTDTDLQRDADRRATEEIAAEADAQYAEATALADRALEGADQRLGWRDAGYASPLAAARVLIGDGHGATGELAAEILAPRLIETVDAELDEGVDADDIG